MIPVRRLRGALCANLFGDLDNRVRVFRACLVDAVLPHAHEQVGISRCDRVMAMQLRGVADEVLSAIDAACRAFRGRRQ